MSDELPALPDPEVHDAAGYRRAFTADQMREYARQASFATAEKMREANHSLFNALQDAKAPFAAPAVAQEPVAWREHVEQRLRNWRQRFVNRSGDQLALDDFMDRESLDDLLDYVLDEYTHPAPAAAPQDGRVALTDEQIEAIVTKAGGRWDGDRWIVEDADLHPMARALLAAAPVAAPQDGRALAADLEAVCKAADAGAGGWVSTTRIREALAAIPAAPEAAQADEIVRRAQAWYYSSNKSEPGHHLAMAVLRYEQEHISPTPEPPAMSEAVKDVIAERRRQIEVEGWTPEHDDEHRTGEMAVAAACYAAWSLPSRPASEAVSTLWSWTGWASQFKPKDERSNLIRAGALILAEIERLDRAALPTGKAP